MVTLTESAANKVKSLLSDKEEGLSLRVFIKSGGCSGFSYGMALDNAKNDDCVLEEKGVQVVIDPESARFLPGAEVDYVDSMMGAGFKITNPNAVSSCGCGSSFRTATEEGKPGSCS
ncbi:iron-sulfur cluster insertion protein ErpA [Effusibacillus consociatus]|uniref:Iron-sulfur cluster insertion protein ErpA n=1 Tax=Effusibacillus consociatus TaxID=1117041 RepID=A0ABV9Q5G9_9BACL